MTTMEMQNIKFIVDRAFSDKQNHNAFKKIFKIKSSNISVLDAVFTVVTGQMLSRKAALTIRNKAFVKAKRYGKKSPAELEGDCLRKCGLSRRKVKTIQLFQKKYSQTPDNYENWGQISVQDLFQAVRSEWGMSDWTASMLAIFFLGMEDVYPIGDGTIIRAERKLEKHGVTVNSSKAKPYRSYLALYLWALVDEGYL